VLLPWIVRCCPKAPCPCSCILNRGLMRLYFSLSSEFSYRLTLFLFVLCCMFVATSMLSMLRPCRSSMPCLISTHSFALFPANFGWLMECIRCYSTRINAYALIGVIYLSFFLGWFEYDFLSVLYLWTFLARLPFFYLSAQHLWTF
jgi:hypothetical protein